MDISFSGKWAQDPDAFGVVFESTVDGSQVRCRVSTEALQDIDPTNATSDPQSQFSANQSLFQGIAESLIRAGRVKNGQLSINREDVRPDAA